MSKSSYVHGSAARKTSDVKVLLKQPRKKKNHRIMRNRQKTKYFNFGYLSFMTASMLICAVILLFYLGIWAKFRNITNEINQKEHYLNELIEKNDEALKNIESSIDLEEIKKIAISELGMTYPKENQIIYYTPPEIDYIRKIQGGD